MSDDDVCSEEYRINMDAEEVIEDAVGEAIARHLADAAQERAVKKAKEMAYRVMSGELFRLQATVSTLQWANCAMPDSKVGSDRLEALMGIIKRISSAANDLVRVSKDFKDIIEGDKESESQ